MACLVGRGWAGEGKNRLRRVVPRDEYQAAFAALEAGGVVQGADRVPFEAAFTSSNRSFVNICPGLALWYEYPLERAAELDRQSRLADDLRTHIHEAAGALRLRLPWLEVPGGRRRDRASPHQKEAER